MSALPQSTHSLYLELLNKCLAVQRGGFTSWSQLLPADRLTVAFVLNRPGWIEAMGYTLAEAVAALSHDRQLLVQLEKKVVGDWPATQPMEL